MAHQIDFLFARPAGYEELVDRINSNPRFVFYIRREDRFDKRTKKAKRKGWVRVQHKRYPGTIKLSKNRGRCDAELLDDSTGEFTGAWVSWLLRNASDLIYGVNLRLGD